jgi:LmbE family N-acetylglucosaminyl deacetylase
VPTGLSLLAVFAHPDDEAFGVAGTLAKYAAKGVELSLVTATLGEGGEISDPALATPETLGEVRHRELQCSADTIGVKHLYMLDYPDGHLAEVDEFEAIGKLVAIIRELRPQVVITFDRNGTYGHSDHIAIYRLTVAACQQAGEVNQYPGQPHKIHKLYLHAMPFSAVRVMADRIAAIRRGLSLEPVDVYTLATPAEEVTTEIDTSAFAEIKKAALACHRTQISHPDITSKWTEEGRHEFLTHEFFSLYGRHLHPGEPMETDLFAGLR